VNKIAKDEAGPTRALFSSSWSDIGQLKTQQENVKLSKLLEERPSGYVPLTNKQIEHNVPCAFALQNKNKLSVKKCHHISFIDDV